MLAQRPNPSPQICWIQSAWETLHDSSWKGRDSEIDIDMREAVHSMLDSCTDFLVNNVHSASVLYVINAHIATVLEQLEDSDSFLCSGECDTEADMFDYYFNEIRSRVIAPAPSRRSSVWNHMKTFDSNQHEDVWITLLYRMCCWWILHDFSDMDTVRLPSRLKGSRLPVFIL